jgi:predicted dehydrogenase
MAAMNEIGIAVIGAGFLAETRARCYRRVCGVPCRLVAVVDTETGKAEAYAARHGVGRALHRFEEVLDLPEVHMVDLCVPNHLHRPMTEAAARAGKHVVCTKPLTAYVGQDLGSEVTPAVVSAQPRRHMLDTVIRDAEAMVAAAESAGVKLMYGENWIYSPSVAKAVSLLQRSDSTIVEMRGGECHSGSHSPFSKLWKFAGGGALLRLGAHPLGTMIFLKGLEGERRQGRPIRPRSVVGEVGDLSRIPAVAAEPRPWIARGWEDVENWGSAILTFEDGSRGIAWASDAVLGGMESRLEIYGSAQVLKCNLSPNNLVQAYAPDPEVFGDEYLQEKLETRAGWSTPMPDEDWTSGHQQMCQAFVEAVAYDRKPLTDGRLGLEVVKAVYGAYVSAAEGRRLEF